MEAWVETWVIAFSLVMARITAFVAAMPYFGGQAVPRSIKAGLVLALSIFWFFTIAPGLAHPIAASTGWFGFGFAIIREMIVGAVIGMAFSLFTVPFQIAGAFIGQEMGLTIAQVTDPTQPQQTSLTSQVFNIVGVMLFFGTNIHHVMFATLHSSFARRPVGGPLLPLPEEKMIDMLATTHEFGFLLAAPISCILFLTSMILALLTRAAPQLNIMSIGFSLRIISGLITLYFFFPTLSSTMMAIFHDLTGRVYAML